MFSVNLFGFGVGIAGLIFRLDMLALLLNCKSRKNSREMLGGTWTKKRLLGYGSRDKARTFH